MLLFLSEISFIIKNFLATWNEKTQKLLLALTSFAFFTQITYN